MLKRVCVAVLAPLALLSSATQAFAAPRLPSESSLGNAQPRSLAYAKQVRGIDGDVDGDGTSDRVAVVRSAWDSPSSLTLHIQSSRNGLVEYRLEPSVPLLGLALGALSDVDGLPGQEIVISGVMGANTDVVMVLRLSNGKVQILSAPRPDGGSSEVWEDDDAMWHAGHFYRKVRGDRIILTSLSVVLRSWPADKEKRATILRIRKYMWLDGRWELFRSRYREKPLMETIDLSPYDRFGRIPWRRSNP